MVKLTAIIAGAGRIGAGYPDPKEWSKNYLYTHAQAYLALKSRVTLLGFVEPDEARLEWAKKTYGVDGWANPEDAPHADIVSICTQPEQRDWVFGRFHNARGYWCEKPYNRTVVPDRPVQVNYIRRFDPRHQQLADHRASDLWVWGKRDVHTVCHFADLARMLRFQASDVHYFHLDGPCSYVVQFRCGCTPAFMPLGGIPPKSPFMVNALLGLLDAVEHGTKLISPAEEAIKSEALAVEIAKEIA